MAELADRGLAVVDEPGDYEAALDTIARSGADVVVTSREGPVHANVHDLLGRLPFLRVVAISADASESCLYELRPYERGLGEISPQSLLAAIERQLPGDSSLEIERIEK